MASLDELVSYLANASKTPNSPTTAFWTGTSTAGENPTLLASIERAVRSVGGTGVHVTSAKRPPGPGNDVSDSNHITGNAMDGYAIIGGKQIPLGQALVASASKFGLRSGDVAGFDPKTAGGYDPVHVDDGFNVGNKIPQASAPATPAPTAPAATPTTVATAPTPSSPLSLALSSIYQANQQRIGIPQLNPLLLALAQAQPGTQTAAAAAPSTATAAGTPLAAGIGDTSGDLYGTNLVQQIIQDSKKVGLDPNVPLSIVPHEGGYDGAVGDNNSSFGPLQDHAGGALPAEVWAKGPAYAKKWANSPQGILYQITGLARAVHGASGAAGVAAGVQNYERPKAPAPEIQKSLATYTTRPAAAYL